MDTKVIFDTNAYRNFVEKYLKEGTDFAKTIEIFKTCEKKSAYKPSCNLLSVLELYQHLKPEDPAFNSCKKAIHFSFHRSYIENRFIYQPWAEIEISERLFQTTCNNDIQLNEYFLQRHFNYCIIVKNCEHSLSEFAKEQLDVYKELSYNSIINNFQRLFTSFNQEDLKFSNNDFKRYKKLFGENYFTMYANLGITLFEAFQKKLNIINYQGDKNWAIVKLIYDYRPALLSYIKILEKFSNNKVNSKRPFIPNKNDLIDSLILFSIVPNEQIVLVTDENKIHSIFNEIGMSNSVITLTNYLKKINFISNN